MIGYDDEIYSSVRSLSLKGSLLPPSTLMDLIESKNLEEFVTRLQATIYQPQVSQIEKPYSALKLEFAFRSHLADVHYNLMRVSPGGELLKAYYYKYIIFNLKVILKGKALNREFEELLSRVDMHAEELIGRRDLVVRAITANTLEGVGELLKGGDFGDEVLASLKAYNQVKNLQIFDLYLDGAFLKRLMEAYLSLEEGLKGASSEYKIQRPFMFSDVENYNVSSLLALDVDSYNTLTVLRGKLWGLNPSDLRSLIVKPTFSVNLDILNKMITLESLPEAIKLLNQTPYSNLLPPNLDEDSLSYLDRAFSLLIYKRANSILLSFSGGLSSSYSLIKLKELEVKNLSAIAFGVEQGISPENIKKKIIR